MTNVQIFTDFYLDMWMNTWMEEGEILGFFALKFP